MIRSIAVDDEPFALDVISIHAAKIPELDLIERFTDPFKALDFLKNNFSISTCRDSRAWN